jgi:hypothetical protein
VNRGEKFLHPLQMERFQGSSKLKVSVSRIVSKIHYYNYHDYASVSSIVSRIYYYNYHDYDHSLPQKHGS